MKKKKVLRVPIDLTGGWLNIREAAKYTHLGVKAIRNFYYDGMLPCEKPPKVGMFKKPDLDEFMEKSKVKGPQVAGIRAP